MYQEAREDGVYQEDKKGRKHTGSLGTVARSQPD